MRKQDSIEFLWDELKSFLPANYTVDESVKILSILKQAKAMHKEEVVEAWSNGYDAEDRASSNPLDYYNETFGGNNEQQ